MVSDAWSKPGNDHCVMIDPFKIRWNHIVSDALSELKVLNFLCLWLIWSVWCCQRLYPSQMMILIIGDIRPPLQVPDGLQELLTTTPESWKWGEDVLSTIVNEFSQYVMRNKHIFGLSHIYSWKQERIFWLGRAFLWLPTQLKLASKYWKWMLGF